MANSQNYKTDTTVLSELYNRYTVSRIIANKEDDLLNLEVPAEFSEKILQNNIEINLYSLADNSLIFSDVIKNVQDNDGAFYTETLQYGDGTLRKLLYINFAKIIPNLAIPQGQYSVSLNFFSDELGSYDNRILKVSKISTSRTEVELRLTDKTLQQNLEQFAIPRITAEYAIPALKQVFNQEGANEIIIPTSPTKIDSSSLYQNFISGSGEKIVQYGFDIDDGSRVGINTITQNVLNLAYPIAIDTINNAVLVGSGSFTEVQLTDIVITAIDAVYNSIIADQEKNPQQYRFNLI